ncbi:MAG: DNA polymerase III subunit delta [Anaerolineaceae bacterium]|nr:DNA polymerase III subunit delta [Anaerolineaceae bacterium]
MADKKQDASLSDSDIIILQGDNQLLINKEINTIIEGGKDSNFGMNVTHLAGESLDSLEIASQLNMLPLGADKHIIIIDEAQKLISKKETRGWLESIKDKFPPTTMLVMILHDKKKYQKGKLVWEYFGPNHWLRKSLKQFSCAVHWEEAPLPSEREMPKWILEEAENQGGEFQPGAAVVLASMVGNDLYQARQEIDKAISYVKEGQQVNSSDVRLLCAVSKEESVFSLVDAVGQRKGKLAFKLLNKLRVDTSIQHIFSMLVRQIRMLILTKETLAAGAGEREVMSACDTKFTFLAKKLIGQSRRFNMKELEKIYRDLDRIDEFSKIGRSSLEVTLEALIAGISAK